MHCLQRLAHAAEQHHESALGEPAAVDEVGVYGVLQVAAPEVGEKDVDCFRRGIGAVADDGVVDGVDDVGVGCEERVGFYFFQGQRDGFLAEGAADLLQSVQIWRGRRLDEVDVGEAALILRSSVSGGRWAWGSSGRVGRCTSPNNRSIL